MDTLIIAGGDINIKSLKEYCEAHIRTKNYCSR